jgi:hypothetical protein
MAKRRTCSLAASAVVACWLVSLLPAIHALVTQPKVERVDCVSKLKGAFTFDNAQAVFTTEPGDVLNLTVVAIDPSGSPIWEFVWLVSGWVI